MTLRVITGVRLLLPDFLALPRSRKILPPFGLLVHRRGDLELAVEIVLGWIDGHAPADLAVEVEPQKVVVFWRDTDHAVGDAQRNDRDLTGRDFDVFKLGEIERVATKLNSYFLAAQRAMKGELLVLHIVGAYPHVGRFHQRLSAGVFAALADDRREVVEGAQLTHMTSRFAAPQSGDADE